MAELCGRCNRKLKTKESKERGYGPKCFKKMQEAKAQACQICGEPDAGGLCEDCTVEQTAWAMDEGLIG